MVGGARIFWAEVIESSNDKGPYKLVRVKSDEHEFTAKVVDSMGTFGNPMKGGQALVALPDGVMEKAVVIGGVPPAKRRDGTVGGEAGMGNFEKGTEIIFKNDGTIVLTGKVIINGDVEINGNMVQHGNFNQSGIHTDTNGPHTA